MDAALAERVVEGLRQAGIDFFSLLPESRLRQVVALVEADDRFTVVRAAHEGTAVGIACGAALAGRRAAISMEATGFFASAYSLISTGIQFGLPLLFLISYVGSPGDHGSSYTFSRWGRQIERQIGILGLQYSVLEHGDRLEHRIVEMARAAQDAKYPAAVLFTGEFTIPVTPR
jgi:sulfopyruvate decarboxylase subunit alpha